MLTQRSAQSAQVAYQLIQRKWCRFEISISAQLFETACRLNSCTGIKATCQTLHSVRSDFESPSIGLRYRCTGFFQ